MTVAPEQIASLERKVGTQARSPLFVQLAVCYLEAGRPRDALRVCDSGLANHPFYSTGHLVKGRTLVALNLRAEARREFELVLEWLPGNTVALALLKSIPPPPEDVLVAPAPKTPARPAEPEPVTPQAPGPEPTPEPEPVYAEHEIIAPPVPEEPIPAQAADTAGEEIRELEETPAPTPTKDFGASTFDQLQDYAPELPAETPPAYTEPAAPADTPSFEAVTFQADAPVDPFGFGLPSGPQAETTVETPAHEETPVFSGFDVPADTSAFLAGIPQPEPEPSGIPSPEARGEEHSGNEGFQGPEFIFSGPADEDTFEKFSLRMRAEISGENTMTVDDYFSGREVPLVAETPAEPAIFTTPRKDQIEQLTEKLQSAKRITPVINIAQKTTTAPSEQDTPTSTGFVTPTLAEIYAKQGWYDDAIRAYRTLAVTKPTDRERFERRIGELEELKKKSGA